MNVPKAHELTKGRSSVIIGILDTGIDATHPGEPDPVSHARVVRNNIRWSAGL